MTIILDYIRIYVLTFSLVLVSPLKISEKHTSVSVQNGSSEVILDCPYLLNKGDDNGLVIKWFYEDEVTPAFQWIPLEQELPQDIGILKGRLDISHSVTNDDFSKHRALFIKKPTIDLSGLYTCYVSNFMEEEIAETQLTVYIPPNNFTIDYYLPEEEDSVTFVCQADGVYPEPQIEFYHKDVHDPGTLKIMDANVSIEFDNDTQTYNATIFKTISHEELEESNVFGCSLKIHQTDYKLNVGLIYFTVPPTLSVSPSPDILSPAADEFIEDNKDLYSGSSTSIDINYTALIPILVFSFL